MHPILEIRVLEIRGFELRGKFLVSGSPFEFLSYAEFTSVLRYAGCNF